MRCSRPQAALSHPRRSAKSARFCRSKMAELTHPVPKRQSAELRSAGLRSKLKKGLEAEGELARTPDSNPFFNQLPRQ